MKVAHPSPWPRYSLALYMGHVMVGYVPGTADSISPVADPTYARKFTMPADAIVAAESEESRWRDRYLEPVPWDLADDAPLI